MAPGRRSRGRPRACLKVPIPKTMSDKDDVPKGRCPYRLLAASRLPCTDRLSSLFVELGLGSRGIFRLGSSAMGAHVRATYLLVPTRCVMMTLQNGKLVCQAASAPGRLCRFVLAAKIVLLRRKFHHRLQWPENILLAMLAAPQSALGNWRARCAGRAVGG